MVRARSHPVSCEGLICRRVFSPETDRLWGIALTSWAASFAQVPYMKRFLIAAALAVTTVPALAADVGVSISIGQPGFYGRIDIGDYPQPRLIYREPRLIQRVAVREPIYLHVPPGHAKNWRKHCHKYDACGEPVYFVQDNWYNQVYVPHYQARHKGYRDKREKEHRGGRKDRHHDDRGQGHGRS